MSSKLLSAPPSVCPECGGVNLSLVRRVPKHSRHWSGTDGPISVDYTMHQQAAYDMECNNCGHEWTSYKPRSVQVARVKKLDPFMVSVVAEGGEPINRSAVANNETPPVTRTVGHAADTSAQGAGTAIISSIPNAYGGFKALTVSATVQDVVKGLCALGVLASAPPPEKPWRLSTVLARVHGFEYPATLPYALLFGPPGNQSIVGYISHVVAGDYIGTPKTQPPTTTEEDEDEDS